MSHSNDPRSARASIFLESHVCRKRALSNLIKVSPQVIDSDRIERVNLLIGIFQYSR